MQTCIHANACCASITLWLDIPAIPQMKTILTTVLTHPEKCCCTWTFSKGENHKERR